VIYVDSLKKWPTTIACFQDGSAHLISDESDEELHAFAATIGLKRRWFQKGSAPHYDLSVRRYQAAIRAGAKPVDRNEFVAALRRRRSRT
jgi:hypothetical protein